MVVYLAPDYLYLPIYHQQHILASHEVTFPYMLNKKVSLLARASQRVSIAVCYL